MENIKEFIQREVITEDGEVVKLHPQERSILHDFIVKEMGVENAKILQEKNKEKYIQKEKTEFNNFINKELGDFFFLMYKKLPKELDGQFKFRYLYLCTYAGYSDGYLYYDNKQTHKEKIHISKLKQLLLLQERETRKTKSELIKYKLIDIDKDGYIKINKNISKRGIISRKAKDYTRVFIQGFREIYINSDARQHKKISTLIEVLPYVNYTHSVICWNPEEKDRSLVNAMTITDISEVLGYSSPQKFKNDLFGVKVKGKPAIAMFLRDNTDKIIVVNPKVYYKGNNINDLIGLINLFEIGKRSK